MLSVTSVLKAMSLEKACELRIMLPMTSRLLCLLCLSCFFAIFVAAITLVPTNRRNRSTEACTLRRDCASRGSSSSRSDCVSVITKASTCMNAFVSSAQNVSLAALISSSVPHASIFSTSSFRSPHWM